MTIAPKPPAEIAIDAALIRALLDEQHPDLAAAPIVAVGEGWDNALFRVGADLVARMPRRAAAAALIAHEQRWLPDLAPKLPLPVPLPVRIGRPSQLFPWAWSIASWLEGETAQRVPPRNLDAAARTLGGFLASLHQPAPADAPFSPWRSVPLAERDAAFRTHLQAVGALVDAAGVWRAWESVLSTPVWPGPPTWIHGDLHPENLLVADGRISGVIDFGDLAAGDPATDLSVAWMLLPPASRSLFRAAALQHSAVADVHLWARARGWALALALSYLAHSGDDPQLRDLGLATVEAVLADD
jgi:aminoglycoside phosphotransferase (APT) family kinase protein